MFDAGLNPLYVAARRVLLDAYDALHDHRDALILVGAQAVYLRAGDADLEAVAPFTTDADLSIDPTHLDSDPAIVRAMTDAGFILKVKAGGNGVEPGAWQRRTEVRGVPTLIEVDLMVAESIAPGSGRDAKLPHHGKNASRIAAGLEASLLDGDEMTIPSLEPGRDPRTATMRVAGSPALLVAKAHKIGERVAGGKGNRIKPKDAGDVFRLMRGHPSPEVIGQRLAELEEHPACAACVGSAMRYFDQLFGSPRARGVELAVDNLASAVPEDEIRAVMPLYVGAMLAAYRRAGRSRERGAI